MPTSAAGKFTAPEKKFSIEGDGLFRAPRNALIFRSLAESRAQEGAGPPFQMRGKLAVISTFFARSIRSMALGGAALAALAPAAALAQEHADRPTASVDAPDIVVTEGVGLNVTAPVGGYDNAVNITGVAQMVTDYGADGIGLCSGTLINPRTVIFAAHCVNESAASDYGSATGGIPISFSFNAYNLPAIRRWVGLDGGALHQTDEAFAIYNAEHVWYDTRSLDDGFGFIQADVALATLDTPAFDIPTWTMLFSALTGPTHGVINGYGTRGVGAAGANQGIDYRRRIAENAISFLGSLNDRNDFLFGYDPEGRYSDAAVYQTDFDSPGGTNQYDFNLFGGDALPREGTTGGGDSGGPLFVDQKYNKTVVAGVLSGGSRFYGGQPSGSYGTSSFYQPLFLYWDQIVANNPYVYASNRGGNRNWSDAANWVQLMDPNYAIDVNGQLVNALPTTAAQGISNNSPRFGTVCFETDCAEVNALRAELGTGGTPGTTPAPFIPGGPGSTNFVPNNVVGGPTTKPRYYDVTLGQRGITTATTTNTVDMLTVTNGAGLTLSGASGAINVLGEYSQMNGTTNFVGGGKLTVNRDAFFLTGTLSGTGTLTAPFITIGQVGLLPGGNRTIGSLTLRGLTTLTSATQTLIDYGRTTDSIIVGSSPTTAGGIYLAGNLTVVPAAGTQPRYGVFLPIVTTIAGTEGQTVFDTFDSVTASGLIKVDVQYEQQRVLARVTAATFGSTMTNPSATARAVGGALDSLRYTNYADLSGVFGAVDYLDGATMAATLDGMAPRIVDEAASLEREQGRQTTNLVADRLSLLGTKSANRGQLTILGSPETVFATAGQTQLSGASASQLSFAGMTTGEGRTTGKLPDTMSGFVAGGYTTQPGYAGADRAGWNMAMGLEMEAATDTTLGTAFAYSNGRTSIGGSQSESTTTQAMAYGAHQLGNGVYVGGLAAMAHSRLGVQRRSVGLDLAGLGSRANIASYAVRGELGVNLQPVAGITLTPRASVSYEGTELSDYREGNNQFGLIVDGMRDNRMVGRVGAKLTGGVGKATGWRFTPEARLDYVSTLAGGATSYDVRFAAAPDLAFALPLIGTDRNWAEAQAGFRMTKERMSFGAGANSSIGRDQYRDDRAVVDFTLKF